MDHTRNSFLHHREALTPSPRLQKRIVGPDLVVDDVAGAWCRVIPMRPFRSFAVRRLAELLSA